MDTVKTVVSVKLLVNYDVTLLLLIVTSLLTINSTLATFCEFDTWAYQYNRKKGHIYYIG